MKKSGKIVAILEKIVYNYGVKLRAMTRNMED